MLIVVGNSFPVTVKMLFFDRCNYPDTPGMANGQGVRILAGRYSGTVEAGIFQPSSLSCGFGPVIVVGQLTFTVIFCPAGIEK
jgi:hypothetical protein